MKKVLTAIGIILIVFMIVKGVQQYNYNQSIEFDNEWKESTSGVDTSK